MSKDNEKWFELWNKRAMDVQSSDSLLCKLIKVDGFDSANQFDEFVSQVNLKANNILLKNDPERFKLKYGKIDINTLQKQT